MGEEQIKYKNYLLDLYILHQYTDDVFIYIEKISPKEWYIKESILFLYEAYKTVGSILSFSPQSPIGSEFKAFSLINLGSLGRVIYDIFYSIYYLINKEDSNDVEAIKKLVWDYHVEAKRLKLLKTYKSQNPEVQRLEKVVAEMRVTIKNLKFMQTLDKRTKDKIIDGESDRFYSRRKIIELYGLNHPILESVYKHFSQFTHATSFSGNQIHWKNVPNEMIYSLLSTFIGEITGLYSLILMAFHKTYRFNITTTVFGIFHFWEGMYFVNDNKTEGENEKNKN